MRVTNKMIIATVTMNISRNSRRLQEIQASISSGKTINRPSDDPHGASQVLHSRGTLSRIEQYNRNIMRGRSWLAFTESVMNQLDTLLNRAKGIAISQSSATANMNSRTASAVEVAQLFQQALQIGNTKLNDRYIFAGQKTTTAPFKADGTYDGDSGEVRFLISPGIEMGINATGDKIFNGNLAGEDVFALLKDLQTALENNDGVEVAATLDGLNVAQDRVNVEYASVGGKMNRLLIMETNLDDLKLRTEELLAETESIDIVNAAVDLLESQNLLNASLAVAGGMVPKSLLDFLR